MPCIEHELHRDVSLTEPHSLFGQNAPYIVLEQYIAAQ